MDEHATEMEASKNQANPHRGRSLSEELKKSVTCGGRGELRGRQHQERLDSSRPTKQVTISFSVTAHDRKF